MQAGSGGIFVHGVENSDKKGRVALHKRGRSANITLSRFAKHFVWNLAGST